MNVVSTTTLTTYLQHTHAVCVAKDLMCLSIVAVSYRGGGYEQLKGVVRVDVHTPAL